MDGAVDRLVLGREQGLHLVVGLVHGPGSPGLLVGFPAQAQSRLGETLNLIFCCRFHTGVHRNLEGRGKPRNTRKTRKKESKGRRWPGGREKRTGQWMALRSSRPRTSSGPSLRIITSLPLRE